MTHQAADHIDEPHQLARKFFILTLTGVVVFTTLVLTVLRYMPNNEGPALLPEPAPTSHLAVHD